MHFELPFSLKGTDKNHTERFSKFPSNIFSILFGYNRILLFLCLLLNSRVAPVVHFNFRAEIQSLCAWIYSLFVTKYSPFVPEYSPFLPDYSPFVPEYNPFVPEYSPFVPEYSPYVPEYLHRMKLE